ncbi:MAG: hypothetical protein ACOX1S_03915 [Anaerostipes sp.]|jgi:hypothetical protein
MKDNNNALFWCLIFVLIALMGVRVINGAELKNDGLSFRSNENELEWVDSLIGLSRDEVESRTGASYDEFEREGNVVAKYYAGNIFIHKGMFFIEYKDIDDQAIVVQWLYPTRAEAKEKAQIDGHLQSVYDSLYGGSADLYGEPEDDGMKAKWSDSNIYHEIAMEEDGNRVRYTWKSKEE